MEAVGDGVWLLRGGMPKHMNVYLIEDEGGVTVFDAGIESMGKAVLKEAAKFGGVKRVVLGHSHTDHRGSAPALAAAGAPVYCHEQEVADAEGDGGMHYFHIERLTLPPTRFLMPKLLKHWDGGPVKITGTLTEGDEVAGFQVVHMPGHAPGLIALWRESDRLALVSDSFYTLDPQTGLAGAPRVPHAAFNLDTEMAGASLRKLSALAPREAWPGHASPMTGDVADQLEWLAEHGGVLQR